MSLARAERLVSDLLSTPAACHLLHPLLPDERGSGNVAMPEEDAQNFSAQEVSANHVLSAARTLFEECQQQTCNSSDITLAMKGLVDDKVVYVQAHRYVDECAVH